MSKQKQILLIIGVILTGILVAGSTFAYYTWTSSTNTLVTFNITANYSCAADGGGTISSQKLVPTSCTNATYALKRTVQVKPTLSAGSLYMNLWLNINSIGSGLSSSSNFKYVLGTSSSSCSTGVVASGTFNGKTAGSQIELLNNKTYSATTTDTYYLYIWLDNNSSGNPSTEQGQSYSFSLGGECSDHQIASPVSFATDDWSTIVANLSSSVYQVGDTREITLTGFNRYNIQYDACITYLSTTITAMDQDPEIICNLGNSGDAQLAIKSAFENGYTEEQFIQYGIVTTSPATYTIRIANKSAPSACSTTGFSQTACGFVVEFEDIITTHNMNSTGTNVGGWPASAMRTYVNNDVYNALPTDIKNSIIDTYVVSSHGDGDTSGSLANNNFGSTDKLYLLSEKEVWNSADYDTAASLSRQLDYYYNLGVSYDSNYASAMKKLFESAEWWWLRTANSGTASTFMCVNKVGESGHVYASDPEGLAPAFRIG